MINMYEKVTVSAAGLFLGVLTVATGIQMVYSQNDVDGCLVSPDNRGCFMNRPIDEQRRAALNVEEEWDYQGLKAGIVEFDRPD
ncbi:MAG: hypothetical protein ACP5D7_02505 [Limnospira sp.]